MSRATAQPSATGGLTFDQYFALPVSKRRQEVIDGVVVMAPGPTFWRQQVLVEMCRRFNDFLTPADLGRAFMAPADVLIRKVPKLRTRQPDLLFLGTAKLAGLDLKRTNVLEIAPDLVAEFRSPRDRPRVWAEKLADYAAIGIGEVWHIDTDQETVEVLNLGGGVHPRSGLFAGQDIIRSQVLPGLGMAAAARFD